MQMHSSNLTCKMQNKRKSSPSSQNTNLCSSLCTCAHTFAGGHDSSKARKAGKRVENLLTMILSPVRHCCCFALTIKTLKKLCFPTRKSSAQPGSMPQTSHSAHCALCRSSSRPSPSPSWRSGVTAARSPPSGELGCSVCVRL